VAAQPGLTLPFDTGPDRFRAVAVPLPSESDGESMSYKVIVFSNMARVKHYPESAIQRGVKGIAVIGFVLDENGGRVGCLLRSSGDADLDAESVALVNRAAPFPPPPPGAERSFAAEVAFGMDVDHDLPYADVERAGQLLANPDDKITLKMIVANSERRLSYVDHENAS